MRRLFPYRLALWSTAVLAALAGLFLALRWLALKEARKTQARAELFLSQALQLEVGRSTRSQVDHLAQEFAAEYFAPPWLVASPPPAYPVPPPTAAAGMVDGCMGFKEDFVFRFKNSALHYLGLAPAEEFGAGLGLYRGILCYRSLGFATGTGFRAVSVDIAQGWPVGVSWFRAKIGRLQTYIDLSAPVPDDIRRGLYDFNFGCLSKVGGCRRGQDLLPWLWTQRGRRGVCFPDP